MFTLFVILNLVNSKEGRAIKAIRDNRIAAESVGINVTAFKLKAFVTSAFLAGMAGALFGLNYSSINASQFNFNTSINILVFVVLGGMGNILGSVISAAVLYLVPELLRFLQDYRMIIYAIVLILVMLFTWSPKAKQITQVIADWFRRQAEKLIKKIFTKFFTAICLRNVKCHGKAQCNFWCKFTSNTELGNNCHFNIWFWKTDFLDFDSVIFRA